MIAQRSTGHDDEPDGRNESPEERADRNWNEVLQELRVLQTGSQVLTGFLLALAFQPAFDDLAATQRWFYLGLISLSALSSILALSPVALHRLVFRRHAKAAVVEYGHIALTAALVAVSLLVVGVVVFVFHVVLDEQAAWMAGIVLGCVVLALWLLVPAAIAITRRQHGKGD